MYDKWKYNQLRQQELLWESAQRRLAKEAAQQRKRRLNTLLARLGRVMIAAGEALHRRYVPVQRPAPSYSRALLPAANLSMAGWYVGKKRCERKPSQPMRGQTGLFKWTHPRSHRQ